MNKEKVLHMIYKLMSIISMVVLCLNYSGIEIDVLLDSLSHAPEVGELLESASSSITSFLEELS
jgi:hypothetical protein